MIEHTRGFKASLLNRRLRLLALLWLLALISTARAFAEVNLSELVKGIQPCVVTVTTYDRTGNLLGQGSGFFVNKAGHIITNYHVLKRAYRANVGTLDGKKYAVMSVFAENENADLIRVATDAPSRYFRGVKITEAIPELAERVIVIGSPMGLEQTISEGIVSGIREAPEFGKIIQITAPISPGSSGSPVLNMKGEIIGVATLYIAKGQNLNFAVPSQKISELNKVNKPIAEWEEERRKISAMRYFQQGEKIVEDESLDYYKRTTKALPLFEMAVKEKPDYVEAWRKVGSLNRILCWGVSRECCQKAIDAWRKAISLDPDCYDCHFALGDFCLALSISPTHNRDLWEQTLEAFEQAVRIKPESVEAWTALGDSYRRTHHPHKAVKILKEAIRLNPDHWRAHEKLGFAYEDLGRWSEAVDAYKQVIRLAPDYLHGHFWLGFAYLGIGRKDLALKEYKVLKELEDRDLLRSWDGGRLCDLLFDAIYKD